MFEAPHNLPVADYAKLTGRSRRAVSYDIQAGKLLSLHLGTRGQRVPDWQIDPLKRQLIQAVLKQVPMGLDHWHVYRALLQSYEELGERSAVQAVRPTNLHLTARLVAERCIEADALEAIARMPMHAPRRDDWIDEDASVAERVRQGGHHIPEPVIRRRFTAGLHNFERHYQHCVNEWAKYDNVTSAPTLIEWGESP